MIVAVGNSINRLSVRVARYALSALISVACVRLLGWEAWKNQPGSIELLLARGADIDATEPDYGYTAFLLACQYGALAAVEVLLAAGCDVDRR